MHAQSIHLIIIIINISSSSLVALFYQSRQPGKRKNALKKQKVAVKAFAC